MNTTIRPTPAPRLPALLAAATVTLVLMGAIDRLAVQEATPQVASATAAAVRA